jgi:hypothetical protein
MVAAQLQTNAPTVVYTAIQKPTVNTATALLPIPYNYVIHLNTIRAPQNI